MKEYGKSQQRFRKDSINRHVRESGKMQEKFRKEPGKIQDRVKKDL